MMTEASHTPLSPIVFHVLLAIADGHEHGYAIGKAVEETSGLRVGPGTIYGSLQRMERDGLVAESADRADERRRPFVMTEEGRRALEAEAARIDRLAVLARSRDLVPGPETA
jgi:DNA-binding PadR family transcriptional regulator